MAVTANRRPASLVALRELGRSALIGSTAAMAAGLVAGGVGSRIAMSLVAIADPSVTGLLTANDNRVGEVSVGGSLFLAMTATLVSAFHGGVVYIASTRLLPGTTVVRGLLLGAALLCVFGTEIIDPTNRDFVRFASPALDIGLFAGLFLLFGLVASGVGAAMERRLPSADDAEMGMPFALAGVGLIALWVVIALLVGADGDPYLIAVFGGAIGVSTLVHVLPGRLSSGIGRASLAGISVVGGIRLVLAILDIVSRDARFS
jgi:hypothetical protein